MVSRAEEALRVSEERHGAVVDNLAEGVMLLDTDGRIIAGNPAARAILGLAADEMTGRTCFDPVWHSVRADCSPFAEAVSALGLYWLLVNKVPT